MTRWYATATVTVSLLVGLAMESHGEYIRWVGSDGNWNTVTNWNPQQLPTETDILGSITVGAVVTIDAATTGLLWKAENAGLDSGTLVVNGALTVATNYIPSAPTDPGGTFEVGRHGDAALVVDGGEVLVGSVCFNGHYTVATSRIEVVNGGRLTVKYFRSDGADSTVVLSNELSSITTVSGNNSFANHPNCQNTVRIYDGTLTTSGRDYWGGKRLDWQMYGGEYDHNGDQLFFQNASLGTGSVLIAGGTLDTAASLVIAGGVSSSCHFVQSAGAIRMSGSGRDFLVGHGRAAEGFYTLSGGTNHVSRYLQAPSGSGLRGTVMQTGGHLIVTNSWLYIGPSTNWNEYAHFVISGGRLDAYGLIANTGVPCTFEVEGSDPVVDFTANRVDFRHTNATFKATLDEDGVSTVNVAGNAELAGATLDIDFTEFGYNTDQLTLISAANINGEFGATNWSGEVHSFSVVYDTVNMELRLEDIVGPPKGFMFMVR